MKLIGLLMLFFTAYQAQAATEPLTDNRGRVIGYEKVLSNGFRQMVDSRGRPIGYYNPKTNQTIDARGRVIGSGNQLPSTLNK